MPVSLEDLKNRKSTTFDRISLLPFHEKIREFITLFRYKAPTDEVSKEKSESPDKPSDPTPKPPTDD